MVAFLSVVGDNSGIKLMQIRRLRRYTQLALLTALVCVAGTGTAFATSSSSSSANYQITETQFGSSSNAETCSTQYCAQSSAGAQATGTSTSSGGTSATFGQITTDEPLLEVIVESGASDLGTLTAETTASKTMTVRIRNYQSNGYVLQITGDAPKYANHILNTPSTPTASTPGTEQFGLNAVANTTPNIGSNPVQVPSSDTSFGEAAPGYDTPNVFQYASGAVVGQSLTASGRTDYTISMILNISNNTPAGRYYGDLSAVVIPVY